VALLAVVLVLQVREGACRRCLSPSCMTLMTLQPQHLCAFRRVWVSAGLLHKVHDSVTSTSVCSASTTQCAGFNTHH
jgi:hypothetical protein